MRPDRVMTQRCSLHARFLDETTEERDDYGNPVPTVVDIPDVPCFMWQAQNVALRGEGSGLAEIQEESFRVILPATIYGRVAGSTVEIQPDGVDAMTVDGLRYEMHGPPWRVFNPRLRRSTHVEATVRRAA
jgi:hypothetical protein